jgi:Fe2+ or Zn2+ uptake regulation protein
MNKCEHVNSKVYARRYFSNNTVHYCVQCINCGAIVRQNGKPHIKLSEIPPNKKIREFDVELYKKLQGWV